MGDLAGGGEGGGGVLEGGRGGGCRYTPAGFHSWIGTRVILYAFLSFTGCLETSMPFGQTHTHTYTHADARLRARTYITKT